MLNDVRHGSANFFYGQGPHQLLWAGSWAARGKTAIIDIPNCPNYCEIFVVYIQFTNVAGHRLETHGVNNVEKATVSNALLIHSEHVVVMSVYSSTLHNTGNYLCHHFLQLWRHIPYLHEYRYFFVICHL